MDVGFLSKTTLQNLLPAVPSGNWPKKLGITAAEIVLPDKQETVSGFYMSLKDMPDDIARSCMKVRLSYEVSVRHEEGRLQGSIRSRRHKAKHCSRTSARSKRLAQTGFAKLARGTSSFLLQLSGVHDR